MSWVVGWDIQFSFSRNRFSEFLSLEILSLFLSLRIPFVNRLFSLNLSFRNWSWISLESLSFISLFVIVDLLTNFYTSTVTIRVKGATISIFAWENLEIGVLEIVMAKKKKKRLKRGRIKNKSRGISMQSDATKNILFLGEKKTKEKEKEKETREYICIVCFPWSRWYNQKTDKSTDTSLRQVSNN